MLKLFEPNPDVRVLCKTPGARNLSSFLIHRRVKYLGNLRTNLRPSWVQQMWGQDRMKVNMMVSVKVSERELRVQGR